MGSTLTDQLLDQLRDSKADLAYHEETALKIKTEQMKMIRRLIHDWELDHVVATHVSAQGTPWYMIKAAEVPSFLPLEKRDVQAGYLSDLKGRRVTRAWYFEGHLQDGSAWDAVGYIRDFERLMEVIDKRAKNANLSPFFVRNFLKQL